jgi:hypothetical protein
MDDDLIIPDPTITVKKCQSWEDFITVIRRESVGAQLFRGHRDVRWRLSSAFERTLVGIKKYDPEQKTFSRETIYTVREAYWQRFYQLAHGLPGLPNAMSPDDWWILGRHHGLVTPLLDWSGSPYVAAFFAFVDHLESRYPSFKDGLSRIGSIDVKNDRQSVAIWALSTERLVKRKEELQIIYPETEYSVHSQRIRAQKSVFTKLDHSRYIDIESYLRSEGLFDYLRRYEIPGAEAVKALRDMELMNISFATLFPDLHGAAKQANLGETLSMLNSYLFGLGGADSANYQRSDDSAE